MNRRDFSKLSFVGMLSFLVAPLFAFGSKKKALVAAQRKFELYFNTLNVRIIDFFPDLLKLKKSKEIVATRLDNTVNEVIYDNILKRYVSYEEYLKRTCFPSWYQIRRQRESYTRKAYLVRWMQIEFQYTDDNSYLQNKAKALVILANLFDKCVEKQLIDFGCLLPACELDLTSVDKDVKRKMIFIYPCEGKPWEGNQSLDTEWLNKTLSCEIFCYEGELARLVVRKDGSVTQSKAYERNEEIYLPENSNSITMVRNEIEKRRNSL